MQYEIQPAQITDIAAMYAVSQATHSDAYYDELIPRAFKQKYSNHYQKTDANQRMFSERLMARLNDPRWKIWVAKDDKHMTIGYTVVHQPSARQRLLKGLFVHPQVQGMGVGKALFQKSLDDAPPGCIIELTVIANNTVAKGLYKKHGFTVRGPADRMFYGAPQEVMQRREH